MTTRRPGIDAQAPTVAPPDAPGLGQAAQSRELALRIAEVIADTPASNTLVLDIHALSPVTDFFVICSGNTERQTKAIYDAVHQELKDGDGLLPLRAEGAREARWILLDYLDCVVHIFTPQAREFYRLENLWGEVPARSVV